MTARRRWFWLTFVAVGFALVVPALTPNTYVLHLLVTTCIWALLAVSMNLILGVTGLLSLAHGALFGIGGYTSALLVVRAGMNFWPALVLAAMAAGLGGLLIGLPTLRSRGPYFVIASLCFGLVVQIVIDKWEALTFGPLGVTSIPSASPIVIPGVAEITFDSLAAQYYLVLALLILAVFVVRRLVDSRIGRAFHAIRVNEDLGEALGVPVMRLALLSFVISGMIAGVAGSVYAMYIGYLNPADAGFWVALNGILFVVVGGVGTLAGPIIGAFVMTILPETFRLFEEFRLFIFGLLLIAVIIFFPEGIVGGLGRFWRFLRREAPQRNGPPDA
ncbi:MAG: branched-chain amino acid ABC transporter permease [Burkholderiaceae bacterium]|nr:branched-chain amino acid ABC transporter permease [Burkholderiaceae bacterium]